MDVSTRASKQSLNALTRLKVKTPLLAISPSSSCDLALASPIIMGTEAVQANHSEAMKLHVARFCQAPAWVTVTPLLELALRLVNHHGFGVSFLNITTKASAAQNQLLHSPRLPPDLHVVDLPPADVSTLVSPKTIVLARLSVIVQQSLLCLDTLLLELNPKPRALVIDLFCTQAFDVCKRLSIPTSTFFTSSSHFACFLLVSSQA
ncbi:hypothetical protein K1719_015750 [Acacia pycnantha]|nr:hypothetical protein K1719_015750 [Acacia pycnantha]